ncbi:attachment glycoprotein [Wenzhou Myotis davidii paramyxovirus 1]|uniref:Attachment glycoprotein n=1 Tax=Wenzhou Myotis davidii paramyxovirus 1 TaxID=2928979 RepID=A0A8T9KP89_9MONO|nr:attachment glycoprotein [Wenzhou Myotis davidii paramyxovirus 1]WPV62574.1 MAG: attachment glycoprotein [Wenzhou bat jeilongvirus 1]
MSSTKSAYFNNPQKDNSEKKETNPNQNPNRISQYGTLITSTLSLVSIIVLLVLNMTSLIKLYKDQSQPDICKQYFHTIANTITSVNQDIVSDIKPKMNLVSSATSYMLPNMLTTLETNIINEISRSCDGDGNTTTGPCTVGPQMFHSVNFALINYDVTDQCVEDGGIIKVASNTSFVNYPSFIPQATTPGGCVRIPSFSLSNTIFSYTHNVILSGCADDGNSYQTWILGYIGTSYDNKPEPRPSHIWDMGSLMNRKSCSTAAGRDYAWLVCSISTQSERDDYKNEGIQKMTIAYQDIRGVRKEWVYSEDQIDIDRTYAALYPSVGSGIVVKGKVYFLLYGGLMERYPGNSYCKPNGCASYNQAQCNKYDQDPWFYDRQLVNALMIFDDNAEAKPTLRVVTIPPTTNWMGAEGRLMYDSINERAIIYTRSTGWHARLQLGHLQLASPYQITWVPYNSVSRPGVGNCNSGSVCPERCLTGIYTDAYPITSDLRLVITSILNDRTVRKNPRVESATPDQVTGYVDIYPGDQDAAYTSTTCFTFGNSIWCLSIIEIPYGSAINFSPIPFLYELETKCPRQTWWSTVKRSKYIKLLTPFITGKTKPVESTDGLVTTPPPLVTTAPSWTLS